MVLLGDTNSELHELLAAQLGEIESRFAAELVSDLPCVNDLARHLEQYRGKMLRPALVLLSSLATDSDKPLGEAQQVVAAVVEMVHMATLVHDDVLDESEVRRRGKTINYLAGNESAVMLGDYLISHAYHLCSSLDSQAIARLIAQSTNTVCEGELLQLSNRNNYSLDEQTYFEIIKRKTAALCGVSCQVGAMLGGAGKVESEKFEAFGLKLGMAFQIIDDVLDLTGDQDVVGKSLGKDLEKGKLTLPLIHWLETAGAAERQQLLDMLRDKHDHSGEIGKRLLDSDAVDYAHGYASRLIDEAKGLLEALKDSPSKEMLIVMADAVITREY